MLLFLERRVLNFPGRTGTFSFRSVEASSSLVLIFSAANTLVALTVWWVSCWLSTNEFQYHLMRTKYQPLPTCTDSDKQRHHLVTHGWANWIQFFWFYVRFFLLFRRSANTSKTVEYFKPLGRAKMDRLFSIYQIDFEMFGYSYEIYAGSWSAWSSNLMLLHILVYTFICPVQFGDC